MGVTRPPWVKTIWLLTAGLIIAIIAVTSLVYAYVGQRNSDRATLQSAKAELIALAAKQATQADCPTWHDASVIPLSPETTQQGILLFADFRRSYYDLRCSEVVVNGRALGALPPADPRLFPHLPVGDR